MEFPKTYAAAKRLEKDTWALGDALVAEIARDRRQDARFTRCAEELKQSGMAYKASYLRILRDAAAKFPPASRDADVTPRLASGAGTPQMLAKAREVAKAEGKPLTERTIERVRKVAHSHERRERSLPERPGRSPRPAHETPVSTIRRHADVLAIGVTADKAERLGREFLSKIAGQELSDDEREELAGDVARVLDTWKVAASAVNNPLSAAVAKFLEEVG